MTSSFVASIFLCGIRMMTVFSFFSSASCRLMELVEADINHGSILERG